MFRNKISIFSILIFIFLNSCASSLNELIKKGSLDSIEKKIKKGANVNEYKYYRTPLTCAINERNIEIVKLLLENGADANKKDKDGDIPITCAINKRDIEIVKLLLENGADANKEVKKGNTPLIYAVRKGDIEILKYLIKNGADVNATNKYGVSILFIALKEGEPSLIDLILSKNPEVVPTKRCVNYFIKTMFSDEKSLHNVSSQAYSIPVKGTFLLMAAYRGQKVIVQKLLESGVDINERNSLGMTALMHAAEENYPDILQLLLDYGADVNAKSKSEITYFSPEEVQEMSNLGLHVNEKIKIDSFTALDIARSKDHNIIVKMLIKAGANK